MQSRIDALLRRHASRNRGSGVSFPRSIVREDGDGIMNEEGLVTYKRRRQDPNVGTESELDEVKKDDKILDIVEDSSLETVKLVEGNVFSKQRIFARCFLEEENEDKFLDIAEDSIPEQVKSVEGKVPNKKRNYGRRFLVDEKEDDKLLEIVEDSSAKPDKPMKGKVLSKKRSYAQCFLELGQPDFLLRRCPTCGMEYTCGDEDDEKIHRLFHDNHQRGIPFKSWRNEKVLFRDRHTGDRIILVLDDDSPSHKHKVLQLADLLERDLGLTSGWLLHKLCKVYMFISCNRVVGCVFAEPIKSAHKIITCALPPPAPCSVMKPPRSNQHILQFGKINFLRETMKKTLPLSPRALNNDPGEAIFCEEESVTAVCGIRAIWVAPLKQRQRIASKLLDAVRFSLC
ncbi:protein CTF7 isoform X2 [Wolffia australiana]